MARRTRVHPLVAALTLAPVAIGLGARTVRPPHHKHHLPTPPPVVVGSACTLPFDAIKQTHAIDSSCQSAGTASGAPQTAQNEAKNNFCATGAPVSLNFANFAQLMQAAQNANIPFGSDFHLPPDRSLLHNILAVPNKGNVGEGAVVRLAAFVMDAHYSNTSSGETVNCKLLGNENNDIHIVLGDAVGGQNPVKPGQKPTPEQECTSVTAEISPHFRPDVWTPGNLVNNNAHLFRFTGQLFFDAAHKPCSGGTGASPRRVAIWEIHPVYAVDICIAPNNSCTVDNDQNWVPLSDFVGSPAPSNETRLRSPDMLDARDRDLFLAASSPPH